MDMSAPPLPFKDWHEEIPSEEELKESIEQAKAELPIGESSNGDYATPERFVEQYSYALRDYLERVMGKEESHLEDLGAHASAFAEAFACITAWF
jgi:hypothetical protein